MVDSFKYVRMVSSASIDDILNFDDQERLNHLVQLFDKYHMTGKRYEARAWHTYFRRIAPNPVVFYQYNTAIFYEDCQYDIDSFEMTEPIVIHGDLHIGQFYYHLDDVHQKPHYSIRRHQRTLSPFTWDLKRLATNLALIAYVHGFSDIEMAEVLQMFVKEYVRNITQSKENPRLARLISCDNESTPSPASKCMLTKQMSVIGGTKTDHEKREIDWQSTNTVAKLLILAEQLAATVAETHCSPPISINASEDRKQHNSTCYKNIIQKALECKENQDILVDEIRKFAMIYTEIACRDHHLFFRSYRNKRVFQSAYSSGSQKQIFHPLADARRVPILIVGGGIGGMATALNFAKAGIRVRLLERNTEFGEVGAGMQLAPNCSRLLDKLGVLERVHKNAVFPKQIVWMDALSGERLCCIDLGEKFIEAFQYPYIVVHRADLFQALHQACLESSMVTMETNRQVTNVDERPKSIMVECSDGMRYDCDLVVAADGLWSGLRKFVHDDGKPISVGYVTYRGTVPIDKISKDAGLENVQFWIGPNMHLVQYPIRRGELFNQAAVFKSKMMPDETDRWGTKEELNEVFSVGCENIQTALKSIQTNFRWPVYDRNPLEKWSRGHLVLLGDAAHPMLQYAGQGAAQALEDAFVLVDCYKKFGPSKIDSIFREYEQKRIPRSAQVMQFARDIGTFAHQDGEMKTQRDILLRQHDMHDYQLMQWLYEDNLTNNQ